ELRLRLDRLQADPHRLGAQQDVVGMEGDVTQLREGRPRGAEHLRESPLDENRRGRPEEPPERGERRGGGGGPGGRRGGGGGAGGGGGGGGGGAGGPPKRRTACGRPPSP